MFDVGAALHISATNSTASTIVNPNTTDNTASPKKIGLSGGAIAGIFTGVAAVIILTSSAAYLTVARMRSKIKVATVDDVKHWEDRLELEAEVEHDTVRSRQPSIYELGNNDSIVNTERSFTSGPDILHVDRSRLKRDETM